jgi:hypothetical protein
MKAVVDASVAAKWVIAQASPHFVRSVALK